MHVTLTPLSVHLWVCGQCANVRTLDETMDTRIFRSCCILVTHGLQDVVPGYLEQRIFFSTQRMHALRGRPLEGFGLAVV